MTWVDNKEFKHRRDMNKQKLIEMKLKGQKVADYLGLKFHGLNPGYLIGQHQIDEEILDAFYMLIGQVEMLRKETDS
jgi:hypothetical protein